jgi:menaquinone-dependent protoporphyrinogen oxidase
LNRKILVTYASRTGTTAEVAQAIGKTLSEGGAQVDVLAMKEVTDLAVYDAVVAGSAVRKFKWLPEAAAFIQTHRAALSQKPFALFTVCIALGASNTEQSRSAVSAWIAPVRAQLNPVSEAIFAGFMDFTKLPANVETFVLRELVTFGVFPNDDRRDWPAIRTWAEGLIPLLAG